MGSRLARDVLDLTNNTRARGVTCCEGQDELGGHVHGAAQEERDEAAGQGSYCCQQLGEGVHVCMCACVRVCGCACVHVCMCACVHVLTRCVGVL